jgi:cytochrome c peroxidase
MSPFKCILYIPILGIFLFGISACQKTPTAINPVPNSLELDFPSYFPQPHYQFINNILSKDRVIIGRELFYDPILSIDSTISCASCHKQVDAFADGGKAFSQGVQHAVGTRNSPAIFNMIWNTSFMADGGINHIEIMPLAPLTVPNEMNEDMNHILFKLQRSPKYATLFQQAFGENIITAKNFFYCLTQFMATIISSNSKYDEVKKGHIAFSEQETKGYQLFLTHCNSCHTEPLFTNFSFQNNGIDSVFLDVGRQRISLDDNDLGKFKVPSLRNLQYTAPYMHNGSFATLDEVIDHYSERVLDSKTLSPVLKGGLHFTQEEKNNLGAFLKTLNDSTLLSNTTLSVE